MSHSHHHSCEVSSPKPNKNEDDDSRFQRSDNVIDEYVKMSIDPKQNPMYPKLQEIVNNIGNISGKICVDFGTGPGIMLPFLSNTVGYKGTCYGIDIDKNFLQYCSSKVLPTLKHKNVKIIQSKVDDICLSNDLKGKIDVFMLAFVINYLQENDSYQKILPHIYDYLSYNANAQVIVLDFDQIFAESMLETFEEEEDAKEADQNAFNWKNLYAYQIQKLLYEYGFFLDRFILKNVVPNHYCLVFKKKAIRYSLWLCPSSIEIKNKFSKLIQETCNKYNVLPFDPHVSLIDPILMVDFDKMSKLCKQIRPFKLEIDRLYRGRQSVRLKMKLTQQLNNAHEIGKKIFDQFFWDDKKIYYPHLSLIYNASDYFDEIFENVNRENVKDVNEFNVNEIEIWLTPAPGQIINQWRKAGTVSLDKQKRDKTPKVVKIIDLLIILTSMQ